MNCVRCGEPRQVHCRADGSNVHNAACGGFLKRWPVTDATPVPVSGVADQTARAKIVPPRDDDHSEK